MQFLAESHWRSLRLRCERRGVRPLGDLPFYVTHDSADVWAHRELFHLDAKGTPTVVAGVPPDYFSSAGQLWGSPLYRWSVDGARGYDWWLRRLKRNLRLYHALRIDHFRGLVQFWQVPTSATTAAEGEWVDGPGGDLLTAIRREVPDACLVAEDLGTITDEVRRLIDRFELPGMRVLQFAFGDDFPDGPYLPHNIPERSVVYTGTHDNNTVRGWFRTETDRKTRRNLFTYLGRRVTYRRVHEELVDLSLGSPARLAVTPIQDLLGLGAEARMNRPFEATGNWTWRLPRAQLSASLAARVHRWAEAHGRLPVA